MRVVWKNPFSRRRIVREFASSREAFSYVKRVLFVKRLDDVCEVIYDETWGMLVR